MNIKQKEHYIMCWSLLSYTLNKYPDIADKIMRDLINGEILLKEIKDDNDFVA